MKLIYWPGIPGRGEFIRLALEYAQVDYEDPLDAALVQKYNQGEVELAEGSVPGLAPPYLVDGELTISQTPNILLYLGEKLKLNGNNEAANEAAKYAVNSLTLTLLDLNNEIHDSHHPVSVSEYYEDQKPEAARKAKDLRQNRIPKFLSYFERVIAQNKSQSGTLYGDSITYADLVLFQVVDGLFYAFPQKMQTLKTQGRIAKIMALKHRLETETPLKGYLASPRRQKYSMGVFRHYPELDGP